MNKFSALPPSLLADMETLLADRFTTAAAACAHHGKDSSFMPAAPPQAVAYPLDTAEVRRVVEAAAAHRVPIIPYGTGTSAEGHISAVQGGICVDLSRMNRVLRVSSEDMDVTVEAGVTRKQLNRHLRDSGLFFPIDPGADASLGGMASTRASGTNTVRYGTMRDNVLSLRVVLPNGDDIQTARRARKSASGLDLTALFVGAGGTLGVVTEVTLRLHGMPETVMAAASTFPTIRDAVDMVIEVVQSGIPIARAELMDEKSIQALNAYSKLGLTVAPTLLLEVNGSPAMAAAQAEEITALAAEHHGSIGSWMEGQEARDRLWQARHDVFFSFLRQHPGGEGWPPDVCVPLSRRADCIEQTQDDLKSCPLPVSLLGHVGDGNFHLLFPIDPSKPEQLEIAKEYNDRLIRRAIGMDGTCTGEHGIGCGKLDYMELEHGRAVSLMSSIKQAVDPLGIMNPGKGWRPLPNHGLSTSNFVC